MTTTFKEEKKIDTDLETQTSEAQTEEGRFCIDSFYRNQLPMAQV